MKYFNCSPRANVCFLWCFVTAKNAYAFCNCQKDSLSSQGRLFGETVKVKACFQLKEFEVVLCCAFCAFVVHFANLFAFAAHFFMFCSFPFYSCGARFAPPPPLCGARFACAAISLQEFSAKNTFGAPESGPIILPIYSFSGDGVQPLLPAFRHVFWLTFERFVHF